MEKHVYCTIAFIGFDHAILERPKELSTSFDQNNRVAFQILSPSFSGTCQGQEIHISAQIPTTLDPRKKPMKSPPTLTPSNIRIKSTNHPPNKSTITPKNTPITARFDRIIKRRGESPSLALRGRGNINPDLSPP
jgi:hypothetical protein